MGRYARFNSWLAARITAAVGTMTCAYLFTAVALISLPAAIHTGSVLVIVAWLAQTLLQLTLLSIIIVGQGIQADRTEARDCETHAAVLAEHAETQQILADVLQLIAALPTTPKD